MRHGMIDPRLPSAGTVTGHNLGVCVDNTEPTHVPYYELRSPDIPVVPQIPSEALMIRKFENEGRWAFPSGITPMNSTKALSLPLRRLHVSISLYDL